MLVARQSKGRCDNSPSVGADVRIAHMADIPPTSANSVVTPRITFPSCCRQVLPTIAFKCNAKGWKSKVHSVSANLVFEPVGNAQFDKYSLGHSFNVRPITRTAFDSEVARFETILHPHSDSAPIRTTASRSTLRPFMNQHGLSAVRAEQWDKIAVTTALLRAIPPTPIATSFCSKDVVAGGTWTRDGTSGSWRPEWFPRRWAIGVGTRSRTVGVLAGLTDGALEHDATLFTRLGDAIAHAGFGAELTASTVGRMVGTSATATLHVGSRRPITGPRAIACQLRIGRLTVERYVAARTFQSDQRVYAGARPFQSPQHKNYTSNPSRIRPGGDRAASVLLGLLAQEGGA